MNTIASLTKANGAALITVADLRSALHSATALESIVLLPMIEQAIKLVQQIDALRASLATPTVAIIVRGGAVQGVYGNSAVDYILVDRDNIDAGDSFTGEVDAAEIDPAMVAQFAAGNADPQD